MAPSAAAAARILHTLTQNFLNFGRFTPNQHLFPDFRLILPGDFLFSPNILSQLSHIHMVICSLKHSFYTINGHYGVYVCYITRAQPMVPWYCGWFEGVTPTDRTKQIPPHTHTTGSLKTNTHRPMVRERERESMVGQRGGREGRLHLKPSFTYLPSSIFHIANFYFFSTIFHDKLSETFSTHGEK